MVVDVSYTPSCIRLTLPPHTEVTMSEARAIIKISQMTPVMSEEAIETARTAIITGSTEKVRRAQCNRGSFNVSRVKHPLCVSCSHALCREPIIWHKHSMRGRSRVRAYACALCSSSE